MLNKTVVDLLKRQVNKEWYSAYLYLQFANTLSHMGLDGFANWYQVQAQEERDHAQLFNQYLLNNGEAVELEAIDKPDAPGADAHGAASRLCSRAAGYQPDS